MATSDAPYTMEKSRGQFVLCLLPKLNEVQWGDVQQVGNEILPDLESVRSPALLVDLSQLDYMGSSMVALLVRLWKSVQAKNGRMVVQSEQKMVTEVLNIAGLNSLWEVVPSREEALTALKHAPAAGSSSDDSSSWTAAIISVIAAVGAGMVLAVTRSDNPLFENPRQSLMVLFALAVVAIVTSGLALLRNVGAPRLFAGLVLVASLGIGIAGLMSLPEGNAAPGDPETDPPAQEDSTPGTSDVKPQQPPKKKPVNKRGDDDEETPPAKNKAANKFGVQPKVAQPNAGKNGTTKPGAAKRKGLAPKPRSNRD